MAAPAPKPMVNWTDFKPESLKTLSPKEVSYGEGTSSSGKYKKVDIIYEYGTPDSPKVDGCLVQFPAMTAPYGVQIKPSDRGYNQYSIMFSFDLSKQENGVFVHRALLDMLKKVHHRVAECIFPVRNGIGMTHFTIEMAVATGLKEMSYNPVDKVTGEPTGKNPTQYYKMSKFTRFDQPCRNDKNEITSKRIPIEILAGAEITGYPLIRFSHIYASGNGKASIQAKLESMVVTDVRPANDQTRQIETLQSVMEMNPDISGDLDAQIAALTGDLGGASVSQQPPQQQSQEPQPQPQQSGFEQTSIPQPQAQQPQTQQPQFQPQPSSPVQAPVAIPSPAPIQAPIQTQVPTPVQAQAPVQPVAQAPTQDLNAILAQAQSQAPQATIPMPQPDIQLS